MNGIRIENAFPQRYFHTNAVFCAFLSQEANFENSPLFIPFKGFLKGLRARFLNSVSGLQKILNLVKFGVWI